MGFSRKPNDSGSQEWRWTSHQTSCLGLRPLLRWQQGTQLSHRAPKLPALANSRPSAALCWVSPDASQGGPRNWIRTWRGFQEDESVNIMELQEPRFPTVKAPRTISYPKEHPLLSSLLSCPVSSDPTAKSVSPFPFFSTVITTKHAHAFLFFLVSKCFSVDHSVCMYVGRREKFCFVLRLGFKKPKMYSIVLAPWL